MTNPKPLHLKSEGRYYKISRWNVNTKKHYKIHKHPEDHDYYYVYNEQWLNKIKDDNKCPECDAPIKTSGSRIKKRECSFLNTHLEIVGNIKPLAYDRKEVIILPKIDYTCCPECGHTNIIDDVDRGEKFCGKCGLVLSGTDPKAVYDWHIYTITGYEPLVPRSDYNPSGYNIED